MDYRRFYDARYQKKLSGGLNRVFEVRIVDNWFYLEKIREVLGSRRDRLLDVGSGVAGHLRLWDGFALGIDLSLTALAVNQGNRVVSTASVLPVASESVDALSCIEMLEHLPKGEAERAVAEFVRVVRPGGLVLISVPNESRSISWPYRWVDRLFSDAGHLHSYDLCCLQGLMVRAGLEVVESGFSGYGLLGALLWLERRSLAKKVCACFRTERTRRFVGRSLVKILKMETRLVGARLRGFRLLAIGRKNCVEETG